MKTKAIILIVLAAVATLSFVSSSKQSNDKNVTKAAQTTTPAGGFMSEDKL
jgi:hypothetical protein